MKPQEFHNESNEYEKIGKVEEFFRIFENLEIENHKRRKIQVKLSRPGHLIAAPHQLSMNEYLLEFEGYPGFSENKSDGPNYAWFHVDYAHNKIIPSYAHLSNPELKSDTPAKGVFPTLRRLIGQNFPDGFTYCTEVVNERTKKQMLEIREKVENGSITITEGIAELKKHYKVKERMQAGFNDNHIVFHAGYGVEIDSRKVPQQDSAFDVFF